MANQDYDDKFYKYIKKNEFEEVLEVLKEMDNNKNKGGWKYQAD